MDTLPGMFYHSARPDLRAKIGEAAACYLAMFDHRPNVAYVNPAELPQGLATAGDIGIRSSEAIPARYVLVGVQEAGARD